MGERSQDAVPYNPRDELPAAAAPPAASSAALLLSARGLRAFADGFVEQDFDARVGFRGGGTPGSQEGQAGKRGLLDEVAAR